MPFTTVAICYKIFMIKKHFKQQIDTLIQIYNTFDSKNANLLLKDCLKTIKSGKKIISSGLGKNAPICEKFNGTLNSIGIRGYFMNTNSAVHGDLGIIEKGDIVILLSKSGNTAETLYLAKLIKKFHSKTWLLTCNKFAKTKKKVDNTLVFNLQQEGDPWNILPNNSTSLFLIFLQSLAMALIEKQNISIKVVKRNHPGGSIGEKLKKIK